jgi:pilin isopeptide linkage protein
LLIYYLFDVFNYDKYNIENEVCMKFSNLLNLKGKRSMSIRAVSYILTAALLLLVAGSHQPVFADGEDLYKGTFGGEDNKEVRGSDLKQEVDEAFYVRGGELTYTTSVTLPKGIGTVDIIEIISSYPVEQISGVSFVSLAIGSTTLKPGEYVLSEGKGEFKVTINKTESKRYDFSEDAGKALVLKLKFKISASATGALVSYAAIKYDGADGGGSGTIAPATITLRANMVVTGQDAALIAGQFGFAVFEGSTQIATATNDSAGNIVFPAISYMQPGTYKYTIKETSTNSNGWIIDSRLHTITVTVSDKNGLLEATVSYPNDVYPVFENQYKTDKIISIINKILIEISAAIKSLKSGTFF